MIATTPVYLYTSHIILNLGEIELQFHTLCCGFYSLLFSILLCKGRNKTHGLGILYYQAVSLDLCWFLFFSYLTIYKNSHSLALLCPISATHNMFSHISHSFKF